MPLSQIKNIAIFEANQGDIEQMIEICAQNLIETNRQKFSSQDFSKKGFLVRRLTFENAKIMIDDKENYFVCVAKNGDEVLGYLIACDIKKLEFSFPPEVLNQLSIGQKTKIFYHKQIVKKAGVKKVGEKLLLAMFEESNRRGYKKIICRIVQRPFFNQASISFHEKFGFNKIGEMSEYEIDLGIYLKISEVCAFEAK